MAFPHALELQLLDIFSSDFSSEPAPIVLPEFAMDIRGESYVVFPRTEIRLSTIFPPEVLRYVRMFGDLGLGVITIAFLKRKVRALLDLRYSEGS